MKNTEVIQQTSTPPREFPLELLERITDNFSKERIIGRGAYGAVYRGVLDGEEIAVKKLYQQPGLAGDQFNECINLMRVQHQNIVRLIGYCYVTEKKVVEYNGKLVFADDEERALCMEYLPEDTCQLDWRICFRIIKGTCEGIKYVHVGSENPIYHLDLKPANILLDKDMIPKIGDFGLSRLLGSTLTCVTEKPIGTLGYMPPEYIDKQVITSKFDVFSLGVIILQIMAGRTGCSQRADMPSNEFIDLVHGNWEKRLQAAMSSDTSREIKTCIELALRCVEDDRVNRPTMVEIVDKLNKIDTAKNSSTGQVISFQRKQDSKEQCGSKECGAVPSSSSIDVKAVPLHHPPRKGKLLTLCTNNRLCVDLYRLYRSQGRMPRSLITLAIGFIIAVILAAIVILVLRFAIVPEVKADLTDAGLTKFTLSPTQSNGMNATMYSLAYNMSMTIGVESTPSNGTNALGTATIVEFERQNATGLFNVSVLLSGEITLGIGNRRELSLTCPLSLPLAIPGNVSVGKANCVPV